MSFHLSVVPLFRNVPLNVIELVVLQNGAAEPQTIIFRRQGKFSLEWKFISSYITISIQTTRPLLFLMTVSLGINGSP